MRYLVSLILLLCVILCEPALATLGQGNACTTGYHTSNNECLPPGQGLDYSYASGCCGTNLYCKAATDEGGTGTCARCDLISTGSSVFKYDQSSQSTESKKGIEQTNSIFNCYHKCGYRELSNGLGGWSNKARGNVYYGDARGIKTACQYEVSCNKADPDKCTGAYRSDDTCKEYFTVTEYVSGSAKVKSFSVAGKDYHTKYYCDANEKAHVPLGKLCPSKSNGYDGTGYEYVECIPKTGPCTDLVEIYDNYNSDNIIKTFVQSCINLNGEIADSGQYAYTSDNGYDFSACKCQYSKQVDGCKVTTSCAWYINPNSESYEWYNPNKAEDADQCQIDFVASCGKGYCVWDGKDDTPYDAKNNPLFGPAPLGYFADGIVGNVDGHPGTKCQPCPAGATTNERGNTKVNGCTMRANETKFCDNSGKCITLPIDVPY